MMLTKLPSLLLFITVIISTTTQNGVVAVNRALGGKKKAGKKEGGGKKGGETCDLFLDECGQVCYGFFEAIASTPPPYFCSDTCATCSTCDCTVVTEDEDFACFQTCACDEFIAHGLFGEAVAFGCCPQLEAYDPQIAASVGC
mmetsp:Transcript_26547/g.62376  ORF Transcript_26547/g.62376 Transcript_26547/m.62376 type:complete len:143 (+) Transcript_26547:111-539(+)|eukprot:CAMPEP_0168850870 /NCGR_PEP_ID=MMETSP0727-20121128/12108_1 /TAXON_ID=265536 /ORGANISM="Amphiprora sp., Strain CCMP467" /LENGTH=142 /DNA_ID=CAMNT_0008904823 /DNA_START=93 /DNA_END=521 /DNA_ORIENTATION=+